MEKKNTFEVANVKLPIVSKNHGNKITYEVANTKLPIVGEVGESRCW